MIVPGISAIPRAPTALTATALPEHGAWRRALQRVAGRLPELPGQRERRRRQALVEAADRVAPRAGRRRHLDDSPHLGQRVDFYV